MHIYQARCDILNNSVYNLYVCLYPFAGIYLLISKAHLWQHANLHLQITIFKVIYDALKSVKVNCVNVINF